MDINLLYHPHHREEVEVTINENTYPDRNYDEWVELMEKVEDGDISYATWYQEEDNNYELNVLIHDYVIKDGAVVSYTQELID
mgnify:CR=1 FL=1